MHLGNLHFVHSSHCAQGIQLEFKFTPMRKEILKKAMVQCMTSEVQFCYVCLKCICICAFSQLEISIHAIGTNNQIEGGNKLCDFLQQSNQRKNCDNKIYCKIFLVPPLHISYNL